MAHSIPNFSIFIFFILSSPIIAHICHDAHSCISFNYAQQGKDWTGICSHGKHQSPINIDTKHATCDSHLRLDLNFIQGLHVFNTTSNGYSLSVHDEVSSLTATDIEGHLFESTAHEFHFHSPSEHTLNGKQFDLELHIVHQANKEAHHSVIAILFEVNDNAKPHPFIDVLDAKHTGNSVKCDIENFLGSKLASKNSFYSYEGSLTTPPCSESVTWYVIEAKQTITSDQLKVLTDRKLGNLRGGSGNQNSRVTQPLHGRKVKKGGRVCEARPKTVMMKI